MKGTTNALINHEVNHTFGVPREMPVGFDTTKSDPYSQYLLSMNNAGTELAARGTQIKDFFGLKENDVITPEMLKYAKDNYVRITNIDNGMTEFFNLITDFDDAAEWLSMFSLKNGGIISKKPIIDFINNRLAYIRPDELKELESKSIDELFREAYSIRNLQGN